MLRILLTAATLTAVATLGLLSPVGPLGPQPASARGEGPWCAEMNVGIQGIVRDCSFWRLKDCVPFVIAGNRGSCTPNPDFPGPIPGLDTPPQRHRR